MMLFLLLRLLRLAVVLELLVPTHAVTWSIREAKHCAQGKAGTTKYPTKNVAEVACTAAGPACSAIYDASCDGASVWFACDATIPLSDSVEGSCVYVKEDEPPPPSMNVTCTGPDAAACVAAAPNGATVTLGARSYEWNSEIVMEHKSITIVGAGMDRTILDRKQGGRFFRISEGGRVQMSGCAMQNGRNGYSIS